MCVIWSSTAPVGHHSDGSSDLAPKHHGIIPACKRGGIVLMVDFHSPPATTRVKVCFLDFPYQRDVPCRVPSVKPTPDNWFNAMESHDPTDVAEDDCLEYQRPL